MNQPKTLTELTIKPVCILFEELEDINEGLLARALEDKVHYESFYGRLDAACERIAEISRRALSQRIVYYDSLRIKIKLAVKEEKYERAAELKRKLDSFWHFLKSDIPPNYI